MRIQEFPDFIFAEKPSGFNTHQSDERRKGFVEYLEEVHGKKFYIASRLDQGTSGALVLPKTPESAHKLSELFDQKKVQKKYLFLTDRKIQQKNLTKSSYIEKIRGRFVSKEHLPANSETQFQWLKTLGPYDLWEALPRTGKPHQIRLHAESAGIPILGDKDHAGTPHYRLFLHCSKLEFEWNNEKVSFQSQDPVWTELQDPQLWIFKEALQKREALLGEFPDDSCWRLIHQEGMNSRVDIFGSQAWVYRYAETELSDQEKEIWTNISQKLQRPLLVKMMVNRGQDPHAGATWTFGDFQPVWYAQENGMKFEFRSQSGQSPGLFLDQRMNRQWLKEKANGKSVLNLFCYTGGFSVAAARGGARQTCSVDVSKNFLAWTKKNFELNQIPAQEHEFWESDSIFFLQKAVQKKRQWDFIVCDPPSFGRSRQGVFKFEKDWENLVQLCLQVLSPTGTLFFSTNFEKWTYHQLEQKLKTSKLLKSYQVDPAPGPGYDFELSEEPLLKSYLIKKR